MERIPDNPELDAKILADYIERILETHPKIFAQNS